MTRALITLVLLTSFSRIAAAHCEIPCGIYGDKMRIFMMQEDIATVEKSMRSITELSAAKNQNVNQLTRWIDNKETHANKIQEVVTQYFMTQRVKVPTESKARAAYTKQLTLLHELLVTSMKMKQTTDLGYVAKARKLVDDFAAAYFSAADLEHLKKHKK